jgi:excisionase family DNA binding protein
MTEPALTVRQVAAYLNVAPKLVYRLAQARDLPGFKVAGTWRFKRSDIDAWIEEQKRRPIQPPSSVAVHDERPTGALLDVDRLP